MELDPALIIDNKSNGRPVAGSRLTRQSLRGVWPALLIPWGPDDRIDESRLIDEIDELADSGVHGTYTGGTAGEFYAQDDATFTKLTKLACRRSADVGIPIQIGCTGLSTRSAQERVRIAVDCGCDAIQFTLPFWLPLDDYEVRQFFLDIAKTAGEIPLVFYQTPRAKRRIDPPLVGKLAREIPTLIGMKDTGCEHSALSEIVADAPDLAIFGTDIDLLERLRLGAKGTYSSVAGLNPQLMLTIYNYCAMERFDLAEPLQNAIRRLMHEVVHPLGREAKLWDSALDRLQRAVGGGNIGLRCQKPYRSATSDHVALVRDWCQREAPILLEWGVEASESPAN